MNNKRLILFHARDLDGKCSAAICMRKFPDAECIGVDYGMNFPWDKVKNRHVIMVDYSLQPFELMRRIEEQALTFTWIDHHKSAIKDNQETPLRNTFSLLNSDFAGCELTWKYLFPNEVMPDTVHYLGRYDVWDHSDPDTMPFQYAAQSCLDDPEAGRWQIMLNPQCSPTLIQDFIDEGRVIIRFLQMDNEVRSRAYCFETEIDGYKALCANARASSTWFESKWDRAKYDVMLTFIRLPTGMWSCSVYSEGDVDCSVIAKNHGGGGHQRAAGFQCEELPFKI